MKLEMMVKDCMVKIGTIDTWNLFAKATNLQIQSLYSQRPTLEKRLQPTRIIFIREPLPRFYFPKERENLLRMPKNKGAFLKEIAG